MAKKTKATKKPAKARSKRATAAKKKTRSKTAAATKKTRRQVKKASSKKTGAPRTTAPPDRRRFVRFPAMCRVDYELEGRRTFGFTSDLSSHGMFLRLRRGALAQDVPHDFRLQLPDSEATLTCQGSVVRAVEGGAGIEFCAGQDKIVERVRKFIEEQCVRRLEDNLDDTLRDPLEAARLAGYYCEVRRVDDAVAVYRQATEAHPGDLFLAENRCAVLLDHLEELEQSGAELIPELDAALDAGEKIAASEILEAVSERLAQIVARRDRAQKQAERSKNRKVRTQLARQAKQEIKELLARKTEALEKTYRLKLEALAAQEHDKSQELAQQEQDFAARKKEIADRREQIAAESLTVEQARAEVEAQERDLANRERGLGDRARELQKRERHLTQRAADLESAQSLRAEIEASEQRREKLAAELRSLRKKQRHDLAEERRAREKAEAEVTNLRDRVEQAANRQQRLDNQIETLRHRSEEQQGETAEQVELLQREQLAREEAFEQELLAVTNQRDELERGNTELAQRLADVDKRRSELYAEVEELREKLDRTEALADQERARVERLSGEQQALEQSLAERRTAHDTELEEDWANTEAAREQLAKERQTLAEQRRRQREEHETRERSLDRLQEQLSEQESLREADLAAQQAALEEGQQALGEEYRKLQAMRDGQERDLEAQRAVLAAMEQELRTRFANPPAAELIEERDQLIARIAELENRLLGHAADPTAGGNPDPKSSPSRSARVNIFGESREVEGMAAALGAGVEIRQALSDDHHPLHNREKLLEAREAELATREEELLDRWKQMVQKKRVLEADRAVLEEHRNALGKRRAELDRLEAQITARLETLERWTELETESIAKTRNELALRPKPENQEPEAWSGGDLLIDPDGPLLSDQDLKELGLLDESD